MENNDIEKLLNFFESAGKLKKSIRYGAAPNMQGDSSADHSWRLAIMVLVVSRAIKINVNTEKALKIALFHDIPEAVTGDIDARYVYQGKILREHKNKLEIQAVKKMIKTLSPHIGKEIYNFWSDYEKSGSREAKFIKALDKIETLLHILESKVERFDTHEMIPNYADKAVSNFPELKGMLLKIKEKLKIQYKKRKLPWKAEYNSFDGYDNLDY